MFYFIRQMARSNLYGARGGAFQGAGSV